MLDLRRWRQDEHTPKVNETWFKDADWKKIKDFLTQHAAGDGEGKSGPSSHPPAGGQVGQLSA